MLKLKNTLVFGALLFVLPLLSFGQLAGDILENGVHIKPGQKVIFVFDGKSLKSDIAYSFEDPAKPLDLTIIPDSTILLTSKSGVNIYSRPLNPLNFAINSESREVANPIVEETSTAMAKIFSILGGLPQFKAGGGGGRNAILAPVCDEYTGIQDSIRKIKDSLNDSKKTNINAIFTRLKTLNFYDENFTKVQIAAIQADITEITAHFERVKVQIENTRAATDRYNCPSPFPDPYVAKFIFKSILDEETSVMNEQKKRLMNLKKAFDLVNQTVAASSTGPGLDWSVELNNAQINSDKLLYFTITIKESGYKLSDDGEIIGIEPKEVVKKTIRIMKFRKFVPEVSAGTAFTFFNYYTYGTTSDSTKQQYVGGPTKNTVKNINISAMINWNLYSENSPIHPLLQLGAGINSGIPTLFAGGGFRFSNNSKNRIRITGGIAATWIKELDKLSVGSKITGTTDIENDLKFGGPLFSPYFGLQYNF